MNPNRKYNKLKKQREDIIQSQKNDGNELLFARNYSRLIEIDRQLKKLKPLI